jgi:hypothetical protein
MGVHVLTALWRVVKPCRLYSQTVHRVGETLQRDAHEVRGEAVARSADAIAPFGTRFINAQAFLEAVGSPKPFWTTSSA